MHYNITVSDEAFEHLKPQRGALWDISGERDAWTLAYKQALRSTFQTMLPYLPKLGAKPSVLDIGAGMGGIDLLIWRRYGAGTKLRLIDAVGHEPRCNAHGSAFGDLRVSRRFLVANGVSNADITTPDVSGDDMATKLDVVVSTRAWCFHFAPEPYLTFLRPILNPGAVLILDVRHGKPEWLAELTAAFGEPEIAKRDRKSDMVVFRA